MCKPAREEERVVFFTLYTAVCAVIILCVIVAPKHTHAHTDIYVAVCAELYILLFFQEMHIMYMAEDRLA